MSQSTHEELVYAAAIVILSNELYPRKLEIVREYIQNSSDALDSFAQIAGHLEDVDAPQIKISVQGKSLLVWDNGIGMDGEEIKKLRRIAYSEKKAGAEAGYKGIGRLAGIAVANKLIISSTSYGDPFLHKFEFCACDFLEDIANSKREGRQEAATVVINRHTTITTLEVDPREHYTLVELREIDDKYPELLDPVALQEYIGDIAPVGFAPDFSHGSKIADKLRMFVPDYSPKSIWLSTGSGDRIPIFKPYRSEMLLAEPEFIEVPDPQNGDSLLAYCWFSSKGQDMLGKLRPSGNKFAVEGSTPTQRKRLAGLVYKLFGFSIGDRSLPLRTLWKKDYTRALWFTGEIHIVNKGIKPTTDRSDFVENELRRQLYEAGEHRIAKMLNRHAQVISNVRKSFSTATDYSRRFAQLESQIDAGGIERAVLRARKEELRDALENKLASRDCKDREVQEFVDRVVRQGRALHRRLEEAKGRGASKSEISDLAKELGLTSQGRKVYMVIMEAIENYYRADRDAYYEISDRITKALKTKF